jgi:hypothetical protein
VLLPASSEMPAADETWTCDVPSWVLSRRRAVLAALKECQLQRKAPIRVLIYVSFSNVTVAL